MFDSNTVVGSIVETLLSIGWWLSPRRGYPDQVYLAPGPKYDWPAARYLGRRRMIGR